MERGRGRRRRFSSKSELSPTSLSRNWLPSQSEVGLRISRLHTAYSSYHALRKLHSDLIQNAISSEDFEHVYDEFHALIHGFKADISCAF